MTRYTLNFDEVRHERVMLTGNDILIGDLRLRADDELDLGHWLQTIAAWRLIEAVQAREALTQRTCQCQLAIYLFILTEKKGLLNSYFPITQSLDRENRGKFYDLIKYIRRRDDACNIELIGREYDPHTTNFPTDIPYLVAGQIAEILFYRPDLLYEFLNSHRSFFLYTTPQAFKDDGGVAGGCYNPQRDAIQLVLSRLYEGFYTPTPGVAPFLHEFGHMLDHASGNRGLIPGMDEFVDDFRAGKTLELQRYERIRQGHTDVLPIGHPYVFQNDGEFIAGYLEMFFRNPHYFAAQNPMLYEAFSHCLRQDPRQYWQQDFSYYVDQNRTYYLSGKQPLKPGITLPY